MRIKSIRPAVTTLMSLSLCGLLLVSAEVNVAGAYQYPPTNSTHKSRIFIAPASLKSAASLNAVTPGSSNLMIKKGPTVSAGTISVAPSGPTLLGYGSAALPTYLLSFQFTDTSGSAVAIPKAESTLSGTVQCANIASVLTPTTLITSGPLNVGDYSVQCYGPSSVSVADDTTGETFVYAVDYPVLALTITPSTASLTPEFGAATSTTDGFTLQITNYSPDFTWAGIDSAGGSVVISSSGLITVTGLLPATYSTVTVTTNRTNYTTGSATSTSIPSLPTSVKPTYTIHFNTQGHGTPIADLTGVTTTTLPTEATDGYFTFSGWATPTGTPVTSPYAPTANSTLYAIWVDHTPPTPLDPPKKPSTPPAPSTKPPVATGPLAQAIILPKSPVIKRAVGQRFTQRAVQIQSVALFAKFADITFQTKEISVPHDSGSVLQLTQGVVASLSNKLNLVITETGIKFTAVKGWTGQIAVPVVATVNKKLVQSFIGVEEDPAPVLHPSFALLDLHNARVSWIANTSQVLFYNLYLGSKLVCTTNHTSCVLPITSINGFKQNLQIESEGHQLTYSTKVLPAYSQQALISADMVHFADNSALLSSSEKSNLDGLIATMKSVGITKVVINGHADTTGGAKNQALSIARANAVNVYILKKLPNVNITINGFASHVPVSTNATAAGRANNRRAEILVG